MNVRIQKMTIQNFKGIKSLEIQFNGHDAIVYGDNATGKTSLFDAFLWLLFGKDSSDRSDFGVKPYDANGQEIHNLETVVEAALEIDGVKVATLKHMLKENWVKKNGQSEQVFSGNQHKYWVNGISHSAGEYEKFVADWHYFLLDLQENLQKMTNENEMKQISMRILKEFYLIPYDSDRDFYEQFEERKEHF